MAPPVARPACPKCADVEGVSFTVPTMKGSYCLCKKCGHIWHVDFPASKDPKTLPDVDPRAMKLVVAIVQQREAKEGILMSPVAIAEVAKAVAEDLKRAEAKDADPALAE